MHLHNTVDALLIPPIKRHNATPRERVRRFIVGTIVSSSVPQQSFVNQFTIDINKYTTIKWWGGIGPNENGGVAKRLGGCGYVTRTFGAGNGFD